MDLVLKVSASQHQASASLDEPGGELFLSALLDQAAQPNKLLHPSIGFDAGISFEVIERGGADGTRDNLALIEHRELDDHSIEVVAQNLTLL